ncbi:MAG: hypothetical protein ACRDFR_04885, partial [Candidatus Limnocylindria bacterium]
MSGRTAWLTLAGVTVAGLIVRAIPPAVSDFPVNDGGLFVAMTRAIQEAGWALPVSVAWNGADLPLTYPPLAFYALGALDSVLGLDLLGVFRWFPLLTSVLIVPAVYLLTRALLRSDLGGLVAASAYSLAPASYVWMIQGGGVTRSPGLLVAVVAVWQVVLLVRAPSLRRTMAVGFLGGLTALVHPGAAVFAAISGALIWAFEARNRRSLLHAAAAMAVALLVVAPWALLVVSRHGLTALTDVPSNGPDPVAAVVAVVAGRYTGVPFMDPLAVIGLALAILFIVRRRFLFPLWFVAGIALSYQYAMVPFGLLVGSAAIELMALWTGPGAPGSRGALGSRGAPSVPAQPARRWIAVVGAGALAAALAVEGIASAFTVANPRAPVHALSPERLDAMSWVAAEIGPDARVAVITDSVWSGDPDSEWFPQLTQRTSVATVQGSEWMGQDAFDGQVEVHRALQRCVRPASVSCVHDWLDETPADYLYLPKGPLHGPGSPPDCCAELRRGLVADAVFEVVYDGPGATILWVVQPLTPDQG